VSKSYIDKVITCKISIIQKKLSRKPEKN